MVPPQPPHCDPRWCRLTRWQAHAIACGTSITRPPLYVAHQPAIGIGAPFRGIAPALLWQRMRARCRPPAAAAARWPTSRAATIIAAAAVAAVVRCRAVSASQTVACAVVGENTNANPVCRRVRATNVRWLSPRSGGGSQPLHAVLLAVTAWRRWSMPPTRVAPSPVCDAPDQRAAGVAGATRPRTADRSSLLQSLWPRTRRRPARIT